MLEEEHARFHRLVDQEHYSVAVALKKINLKTPPLTGQTNYQRLREIWEERGMHIMKDFLAYYNNLDVLPFCQAVSKMLHFFTARNIDLVKTCISAPGVARENVFRSAAGKAHFACFDFQKKDLYTTFKKGMYGGGAAIREKYCFVIRLRVV